MCDIRYFRMARHHFISAKEALKCFSWDELFINDTAYKLQQCVEFTLKAFLECKGVTVPETHQLNKLIRMSKDNGSACIITEWLEKNAFKKNQNGYDHSCFGYLYRCYICCFVGWYTKKTTREFIRLYSGGMPYIIMQRSCL